MPATLARRSPVLKIDPEFRSIISPLAPDEYYQLEANLSAEGCRDALVTWHGFILDGHNRFEICNRIGIRFKIISVELPSREAAKLWIEENQLGRRNLTPDQRAAIAYRIMQRRVTVSKMERARKGGLRLVDTCTTKKPRERERTATQLRVSTRQLRLIGMIAKHDKSMVEKIVTGKVSLRDAKLEVNEDIRKRLRNAAIKTNPKGGCIHTGDLSILHRLLDDNSVALFLSDPPYEKDAISLYGKLAELAQRKLKPGGLCAVMCGQLYFDQVFTAMCKHLDYYWICGVGADSAARSASTLNRRMLNVLRLVLIFSKRPLKNMGKSSLPMMVDLISGERDKKFHTWGQGLKQFQYFVEHLSEPGDLVVDPFLGGGTVPVACLATGRRYMGTEINPGVAAAARVRVQSK
jgi:ParB-like chromosome segregation protein Spo0J